jgi:hypothetical protein
MGIVILFVVTFVGLHLLGRLFLESVKNGFWDPIGPNNPHPKDDSEMPKVSKKWLKEPSANRWKLLWSSRWQASRRLEK